MLLPITDKADIYFVVGMLITKIVSDLLILFLFIIKYHINAAI